MKPRDFAYTIIIIVFFAIVVILFFSSTKFISNNITKSFSAEQAINNQSLNKENYLFVAKKLGMSTSTKDMREISSITTQSTSTVPTEPVSLDKKSLSITILNSTTKNGAAIALAKVLTTAGYEKPNIGKGKKKYATTTIFIKESMVGFKPALLEEVLKVYSATIATTTPETSTSDATIIIGSH